MTEVTDNIGLVQSNIYTACAQFNVQTNDHITKLIAVSKNHDIDKISEIIKTGHHIFGENKVQEATEKWTALRKEHPNIELHMLGSLQSNKVRDAVAIFDVIQTIDRIKIANYVVKEMALQKKDTHCFVQVNIGEEPQKSGVVPSKVVDFVKQCQNEIGLSIKGLMCIPPANIDTAMYFSLLKKLALESGNLQTSMGMSADYQLAVAMGADYVRVGTAIFGQR